VEGFICRRSVDSAFLDNVRAYFLNILGSPRAFNSTDKEIVIWGDSGERGTDLNVAGWRRHFFENIKSANPTVNFCGTITNYSYDQPQGYPSGHEAVSGATVSTVQLTTCGFWTGTNVQLGQAGDPGAGSRGDLEVLAAKPDGQGGGHQNGGVILVGSCGNNDISSGDVDVPSVQRLLQRMINIHGRVKRLYFCKLFQRTDSAPADARIDTFNAAIPGMISTLQGLGYPVAVVDWSRSAGYLDAWLQADGLHQTSAGGQFCADQVYAAMQANGDLV